VNGKAFAKVNLSLRVGALGDDGLHRIFSLAQSVDWADQMTLVPAEDGDTFLIRGADLEAGDDNLAWRAVSKMRSGSSPAITLELDKAIAIAAGLGGGSADAALGLALGAELFRRTPGDAVAAAADLGSDVAFCLAGGTALLEGTGDQVKALAAADDFAVAIIVPPFELATPAVYRRWDELGGPTGPRVEASHLPASVREHAPLINDLQPAAVDLVPELGDWISETTSSWGQPVAMSGSGPSLFSLFGTVDEAADAVAAVGGVRASAAARPVPVGWEMGPGSTLPPPPWGVV
jgi:4-diphosphocytidyl-2-C-methyl-D-erythritol kinase